MTRTLTPTPSRPAAGLAVQLRGVSKRFPGSPAPSLDSLDLEVAAGSVFGFLGTNGAGKTTTLRVLLGLVRPDEGEVRVLGLNPRDDAQRIRAAVGVLLENDGLYDRLTATQNLEFHARIRRIDGAERSRRVEGLLRSAGLWERRSERVVTFSRGMRQKLAIARALVHRPHLALLDEPFAGLDPVAAAELRASIAALAQELGTTVLLTTHDLGHVEKICDRIAVLRGGRVVACGTLEGLHAQSRGVEVTVRGAGLDEPLLAAMKAEGRIHSFEWETTQKGSARIMCSTDHRVLLGTELVKRGVLLEELTTVRASLEDLFLSLVAPPSSP